jgi:hypothetical protein
MKQDDVDVRALMALLTILEQCENVLYTPRNKPSPIQNDWLKKMGYDREVGA